MARSCIPLLTTRSSIPQGDGVYLCIAASRLRFPVLGDAPPDDVSLSTVLLNFSTSPTDRRWAEAAGRGFAAATIARSVLRPDQVGGSLADALATHADAGGGLVAVVALPRDASTPLDTVQQAIDILRGAQPYAEVVVAVSEAPEHWQGLRGIAGWVRTPRHELGQACAVVCRALATLMAPEALTCLGLDELLQVFDGPSNNISLAQGIWLRERRQLCLPNPAHEELVRHSDSIIAFHYADSPQLADVRGIAASLRDMAPAGTEIMTNITSGLWDTPACGWPGGASPVALLCRPRT